MIIDWSDDFEFFKYFFESSNNSSSKLKNYYVLNLKYIEI